MNRPAPSTILLRAARIVLPGETLKDAGLLIEGDRIKRVINNAAANTRADTTYDLPDLTLLPGFIDVHIHGAINHDVMSASADDLHRVARFLAAHGTTAWLPTIVPAPNADYESAARAVENLMRTQHARPAAARALGIHYEGPFVNTAQCGALRQQYFREWREGADLAFVPEINLPFAIQMMTFAPEIAGGIELARELTRRGWIASIGHTRANLNTLERARRAGATHATHLMNAMAGLHHRDAGASLWCLLRDDVTCDVIADGVHIHLLMLQLILRCKMNSSIVLISDAVAPTGMGDGDFALWGERISVRDGRTRNQAGALAGSVITLLDAVRLMLRLNVSIEDVARMAATNPARLLGIDDDTGALEAGKRADVVAIDDAGRLRLTFVGGRVVEG